MKRFLTIFLVLLVVVSIGSAAVMTQATRARKGAGILPSKLSKGSRCVPVTVYLGRTQSGSTIRKAIPVTKVGTLSYTLGSFPIGGYVSDFYLIAGTLLAGNGVDSILNADTVATCAYKFVVKKWTGAVSETLGVATTVGYKPKPDTTWFITGTDTTSKAYLKASQRLTLTIDTVGAITDSLPVNMWIRFLWFPGDKE
jgi:hypothetical protein